MMTVLQIVSEAAKRLGIRAPGTAYGSTDPKIIQLTALCNEEGQSLASRHTWTALIKEASFTTLAQVSQGAIDGTIVSSSLGFHSIINDTIFNRTTRLPVFGPLAPRTWQARLAISSTGPTSQYRIRGGALLFDPVPAAGDSCYFEYRSKNWCQNAAGDTTRSAWGADDDTPLLSDQLILLGLKWRWKEAKGLDYAQDHDNYEYQVADAIAKDGTKPTLSLMGARDNAFDPVVIVPSGNWTL